MKSTTKFLCVNTVSNKVVRHSLAYPTAQKWFVVDAPFYLKFWPKLTHPFKCADFQSIFAGSVSAVTPSEKVQLTRIGSPLRAFQ